MNYLMKLSSKDEYLFLRELFPVEIEKTEIEINKPVHLGQSILEQDNTLMYDFHYYYMQPK